VIYEQLGFRTRAHHAWCRAFELALDAVPRERVGARLAKFTSMK
jgi:hypothetical protein